ncbi:DNA-binding transcription factor [Lithospermum erythrorhizon]|uniref:DNA-binding transcription factor n=1 Tax=Lithospermum erythrorhizon TaxID=34254 RepID=A0AAV3QDC1_LITER
MDLEQQLTLAVNVDQHHHHPSVDQRQPPLSGGDEGGKAQRLPRWTRSEILVLIQGKKVAETRVRRGRTASLEFGSGQIEPKWATVSSYCKKHGVNRGPVQCRKRWSNLAGDFKKIKEYESTLREESESFWVMRNDLRREKRLPGFFDKEVYDILDGGGGGGEDGGGGGGCLTLALTGVEVGVEAEPEAVFDSGRSAVAEDGLFSDGSQEKESQVDREAAPTPISVEKQYQPFSQRPPAQEAGNEKEPALDSGLGTSQSERKRKRYTTDEDDETTSLQQQLITTLERNGKMISSHLEAQNSHYQSEREQQKDHFTNLVAVLGKVADALAKIADKL